MRTFEMVRNNDETGVSGIGKVLEGVVFSDGPCVIRWTTELNGRSESRFDSFGTFIAIHVSPHPTNKSIITFNDGEVYEPKDSKAVILKPKRKRKVPVLPVVEQKLQDVTGTGINEQVVVEVPHKPLQKE